MATLVVLGVSGTAVLVASPPAFAAGPPTVAAGYGAFENNPTVNLTGCTGTTSSETLTCTTNPITAGVTVGMSAYGLDLNSSTPNEVLAVTSTTIGLGGDPSATVTSGATETFTNNTAMADVSGSPSSTTLTDGTDWYYYGIDVGMEVYGAGIAPDTTVVTAATSSTNLVLSQAPTGTLSAETIFFNAPDINNVLTQVTGGAANVNTSSLTVVSQPPTDDGYVVASTTSTTGLLTMYPALNPADSSFSATFAYCAPTYTYPNPGECTTATETYGVATGADMGDQLSILGIETENIYENAASAHFGATTVAQGHTVTLTTAPVGSSIPTTSGGASVNYIDGDTSITPVPAGLTYVPGSLHLSGGDAKTSASGAVTAEYCTAAGTGCTANMTGNYKTTYPYIEEQLGTASADEATGGALQTLPGLTVSFTATGASGTAGNTYLTEFLVDTNVTDIIAVAVDFDGYPTSGATPYCSSNCSNGASTAAPPYVAPSPISTITITPSVTGTSTANGNDDGADTGGQTVQIAGSGFTNAGGEQVYFGANPATSFTVNSNTSITAVAPPSTSGDGPVDVTVTNGGQTSPISRPADQFTYIPPGAPDYPLNVVPTSDNGQAEVSWTPGFNEGSATQSYLVTATDTSNPSNDPNDGGAGGETCAYAVTGTDGPTDSCTVPGLTNGDNYSFQVTATNALGTSVPSPATTAITIGDPAAPTGVTATAAQNANSTISWTDPVNTGAGALLDETVTASPGGGTCTYFEPASPSYNPAAPADQCDIAGLTNGTSYTFTVTSTNSVGTGVSSAPSAAIVPSTVPGAPTGVSATSNANAQSVVTFTAPASNGGAAVTGYTVSAADTTNPSNPVVTQAGAASPITVTGLNNGDTYSITVAATNASGTGTSSTAATATPSTVPGAPTGVTTATGPPVASGAVAVSWTPPASNGGAGISKYTVTSSNSKTCSTTSTPPATPAITCTVTGETNGTAYTFTVVAQNASGSSVASSPPASATPTAVPATPSAPTVATAGLNGQATITWTAPNNEGLALGNYTLTPNPACSGCTGLTAAGTATSTTVSGLANGTSYTFTLTASNADGNSAASSASTAAVAGIPATPVAPTATSTSTSGQDSVSWTAPASASGNITSYTLTPSPACSACTGLTVSGNPANTSSTVGGLTNGTSYTFTVKATNASGSGAASAASTGVVTGSPTAPTNVVAVGGTPAPSGDLNITWSAPSSSGLGTIDSYTATAKPSSGSSKTCTSTSTPPATPTLACQVTGATNGTAYTVTVTATNSTGSSYTSVASAPSATAYPSTTFGAPTIGTATAGNLRATLTWTAPAALTGTQPALTGYVVTPYIGSTAQTAQTFNSTATTETVTGLTVNTAYTFEVAAINANGTGTYSGKSNSVTITGTPGAPTNVVASPGNHTATVTWVDGPSNGSTTTSYTVTATDTSNPSHDPDNGGAGDETCTYTVVSPEVDSCTFTGSNLLTNGDSYTFTVTGTNANGTGAPSSASSSVTPSTVPDAPTNVSATPGNQSASVSWTAPFNEGSAITGYTVTATGDGTNETCITPNGTTTSCTVDGLTNGTAYTFTVAATNTDGTGAPSVASSPVTPSTVPDAPTGVSATPGNQSATVSWTAPFNEGSAITGYTVTATGDGTNETCSSATTSCTFTDLSNGTAYTFTVTATNVDGTGAPSLASTSVTPSTVPDAPTGVTATPSNQSATVSWTAPFDEGSAITGYTVTATGDGTNETCTTPDGVTTTCTVDGLTNGTAYTFTVTAANTDGTSAPSVASTAVTPSTVPDAPTGVSGTAGDQSATVSWTAGGDEGSAITGYTVTATGDGTNETCSSATTSCTVTGLTNGTAYTFTVTAANVNGTSAPSVASTPVTPSTVPDAPTGVTANPLNQSASVSWTAPFDEGSAITGYTVTATGDGTNETCTTPDGVTTSCTVDGLTNGTAYTFTVTAANVNGTSAPSVASTPVTPVSVPDAPTGVSATAGDQSATVSWTAAGDEGSAVTGYTVTATGDGTNETCTTPDGVTTSCTVDGLANGTAYTFTVTATNGDGTGAPSVASSPVTPSTVPGAPTGVSATAGNGSASVSFVAPSSNGSAVTGYTVTSSGGQTASGSGSPITVSGLTNGTAYTFTVTATNADGTGAASNPSNTVTPSTVPGAPTGVGATAGNGSASVSFTAPASNGSAVTGYTVTSSGGQTASGSASPITVTGLTNGTAYTFTVTATNGDGTGSASVASNSVTPTSNTATITSAASTTIAAGRGLSFTITTGGSPTATVSETGLPAWMTFTPGTGRHAGTAKLAGTGPAAGGAYAVTVHANNGVGPDTTQVLTVHVLAITSLPTTTFTIGTHGSYTITTAGVSSGVTLSAATLSAHLAGLSFHDNGNGTATLSGTPGARDKTATVKVTATSGSVSTSQLVSVTIN
ncbi:MAG: fibronectin type III domain-containing protein [Acidimicrobiales bacterium]